MMRRRQRGVALILVLSCLLGLMVLAAPFLAIALNDNGASENLVSEARVRVGARAVLDHAKVTLERTTPEREFERGGNPDTDPLSTPLWDTEDEFKIPFDLVDSKGKPLVDADGVPLLHRSDPRGDVWDVSVRDTQATPNLWTSPPFLIAASLGRTVVTSEITDTDGVITVEETTGFPPTNGYLFLEGERISYARATGNQFLGCQRGLPGGGKARKHQPDAFVIDDRARELAMLPWKSPRKSGAARRESPWPGSMKEVALYSDVRLSANDVDRLARDFSLVGGRPTSDGFGAPTTLAQDTDPTNADVTDGYKIVVRGNDGISPGTVIRITNGATTEYNMVFDSQPRGAVSVLALCDPLANAYAAEQTFVAPLLRHPVNVNTATKDTLLRVVEGLQFTRGRRTANGTTGRVTRLGAEAVVDALLAARPVRNLEQLRDTLQNLLSSAPLIYDQLQMLAVFRNAIDPGDKLFGFMNTVPFSFRSYDHYTITASAVANDRSGRERARRVVTEQVRIASPGRRSTFFDTQWDFEEPILAARTARWFSTWPKPLERFESQNQIPPSRVPRLLLYSGNAEKRSVFPDREQGDVRLSPARLEPLGGFIEHFDGQAFQVPDNIDVEKIDPDGWMLEKGAYQLPKSNPGVRGGGGGRGGAAGGATRLPGTVGGVTASGGGNRRPQSGTLLDRTGPNPVKLDGWFRFDGAPSQATFFHLQASDDPNQFITLSREADGRVKARVADRTLPNPASTIEEVAETTWMPESGVWKSDTWYHAGMSYKGSKPSDVAIWWDGMKRGKAKYSTRLAGSMARADTTFTTEDAEGWPDRGAAWVGREIVEFERTGTSFSVITYPNGGGNGRGRRGTSPIDHAAGERVELFGYSLPLLPQQDRGGVAIPKGGGKLASDLGPFNLASFASNAVETLTVGGGPGAPAGGPPPITMEVHDPSKPNGDRLDLVLATGSVPDFSCFQPTGGYVLIVSSITGQTLPGGVNLGGIAPTVIELATYQSRSGSTLLGLSSPTDNPITGQVGGNIVISQTRQKHWVRRAGQGSAANVPTLCRVIPLSIGVTNVANYFEPRQGQNGINPEFVSVGLPNFDDIQQHKVEWIRYTYRDTGRNLLVNADGPRLDNAVQRLLESITNAAPAAAVLVNQALRFRSQGGTAIFGYDNLLNAGAAVHGSSEEVTQVFRVPMFPGIGTIPVTNPQPGQPTSVPVPAMPGPGWGDSVTVESSGGGIRRRFDVAWSANIPEAVNGNPSIGLAAFATGGQEFTVRQVPVVDPSRETYTRLLKFPSGELPRIRGNGAIASAGGQGTSGALSPLSGRLDEVRIAPTTEDRLIVWDHAAMGLNASSTGNTSGGASVTQVQGIDESTDEIPLCRTEWVLREGFAQQPPLYATLPDGTKVLADEPLQSVLPENDAGLVQIGDEIIAFRQIGTGKGGGPALLRCIRGFMNTVPQKHGFGTSAVFLDFVPVSMLQAPLAADATDVNLASTGDFVANGGLVLVDDELIHYSAVRNQNTLTMPPRLDEKGERAGGLFRGRFGTLTRAHDAEAIVMEMPFRHWDRGSRDNDSPELAWYGFSLPLDGAWFDGFRWEEQSPSRSVRLTATVRLRRDAPWAGPGAVAPSVWRFDDPAADGKQPHPIRSHGEGFDVRFGVSFESGCFDPVNLVRHEWKMSPILEKVEVIWMDETRTLTREERR